MTDSVDARRAERAAPPSPGTPDNAAPPGTNIGDIFAAPAVVPTPLVDGLPSHTRVWFVIFVAWMAGLVAVATSAELYGGAASDYVWVVALLCFYLSLCNALLPLPTAWIVLVASSEIAGAPGPVARVLLVTACGAAATMMANLNEYHVLSVLLRRGAAPRLRKTRLYEWAARWFHRAPFALLLLVAFVPIPVDAVRWLAILEHYSRPRFAAAYFVGRGARYALFGVCQVLLGLSLVQIAALQAGLVVFGLLSRLVWRWRRRSTLAS